MGNVLLLLMLSMLMPLLVNETALGRSQGTSSGIKIGEPAPELGLEKLLQASSDAKADWDHLKGKVVVLEFWATWCAPCIAAIPHLNELASAVKDKPIQFIAITDEDEAIVGRFLKRRAMKTWVGLDLDRSVFKAYGVRFIPYTVVVGPDGKIATITNTKSLAASTLSDILDGKPPSSAGGRTSASDASVSKQPAPDDLPARFSLSIRSTTSASRYLSRNPGKSFQARAADLRTIMSFLYNVSKTRIAGPSILEEARYEVSASMLEGIRDDFELILKRAFDASFNLRTRREMREMEVYVLSVPDGNAISLVPSSSQVGRASDDDGVIAATAVPLAVLVEAIEGVLKLPVVDETNLKGKYDWTLLFDQKDPQSLIEEVRRELGLELRKARRQTEILVVEVAPQTVTSSN